MKRAGFTLVELLVVIAIMAFLMAISVPSLQNSRQQARAVVCGSNTKQLTGSLFMYETENQAFPHAFNDAPMQPPPGGYPGNHSLDKMGWWWFNYISISNYSRMHKRKQNVLWCPSRQIKNRSLKGYVLHGNYGVNQSICKSSSGSHADFIGTPLRSSDIPHPCQTLLVVDSGYSMINWQHATNAPLITLGNTIIEDTAYIPGLWSNDARSLLPGQKWDAINGRHPNKSVNVGYVDGHVSRTKADDLFVEKTNNGYKNRSPLWRPK